MIASPTRRIWLYPTPDGALEIVILGDDDSVAEMYARIRRLVETWRGFDRVSALGQSGAVLGVRVTLARLSTYATPVLEGMLALHTGASDLYRAVRWDHRDEDGPLGVVGTW